MNTSKKTTDFLYTFLTAPIAQNQPDTRQILFSKRAAPFCGQGVYFGRNLFYLPCPSWAWLGNFETALEIENTAAEKEKAIGCTFVSLSPFLLRKIFWTCIDRSVPKNFALFQLFEYLFHRFVHCCFDAGLNDGENHLFKLRLLLLFLALLLRCVVNSHFFTSTFAVRCILESWLPF